MQKYIWTEQYSVGVKEIDEQHQHFFEMANEVVDVAKKTGVSVNELLFKITNLRNYAVYHLLTEENIFNRYHYPEAQEHINTHNIYREKMKEFIAKVEKEGADTKELALKIAQFAGDWLSQHILVMDQKYANFMHEKGIN